MNRDQFYQYLKYPEQLNSDSLLELDSLVKEFPFSEAARMLYVKNLKKTGNIKFNKELKSAAAYLNNRTYLFGLLNGISISDDGSFYPIDSSIGEKDLVLEKNQTDILSLSEEGKTDSGSINENIVKDDYTKSIYVQELEKFIPIADMDLLLFDNPVEDKETLDFDFEDELPDVSSSMPVDEGQPKPGQVPSGISSRDLIDEFIRANPRMPKPAEKTDPKEDVSEDSLTEKDAFMTETLAEIYLKQGYYYKAIHAYEKLSLKYPEKSIYFASQIKKIKELITNQ